MTKTPEDVIAELRNDAAAHRRRGNDRDARNLDHIADDFERALAPIRLVSEHDAMRRDGESVRWHRRRFAEWHRAGSARLVDGERFYRLNVLPIRVGAGIQAVADGMVQAG